MRSLVPDGLGPGARVGSWLIEAQLSTSGSGTVYRAQHTRTRRRAAVKVLHAELAGSREASARFAREVRATQHARHPGLMRVFGAGSLPDGRPWFAMELVEGRDVSAILRERGALSPAEALAILEPLAAALTVAHARGIVHRDVKAASVLVMDDEPGPRVVLLDCGVARFLGAADAGAAAFAPEQTAGQAVDARADVYGLGVLLFQMLTGELPFADASPAIMRQLHRWARRPNPSNHASLAPEIDAVVTRAMARDPDQRHESVEALVRALRAALVAAAAADPDGRPTEAARAASGVAVHLELHGAEAVLTGGDVDDGLADALHAMLPRAVEHFGAHGFVAAIQMGHAAVLLRPASGAAPSRSERAEALAVARACVAEAVRAAPTAGTRRPRLRCYLDVRAAELAGGRVVGGPVLRLAEWVPDDDTPGVHGSSRALADLEPPPGGL